LQHVFFTSKITVLIYSIHVVLVWDETVGMRMAILAHINRCALDTVIMTASLVNWTCLISDHWLAHELKCTQGETTMTAIIVSWARYHNLRRDVDVGPGCFAGNFNSIWEGRSCCVGPARTAVLRNVLVSQVSKIVDSIDIIPNPSVR
jgi:hypothetical protein